MSAFGGKADIAAKRTSEGPLGSPTRPLRPYSLRSVPAAEVDMKIHRLDHNHVYCSDPDDSVRFYAKVFEAQTLGTALGSDGGIRYFLRLGGLTLVLAPYPQGAEPRIPVVYRDGIYQHGYGVGHFGLHVENVDESVESVRQRGAKGVSRRSICICRRAGWGDH